MRKALQILVLAIFITSGFTAEAQEPVCKNFTTRDGLPTDNIYSVTQDNQGFMWFATDNGISRFDGKFYKNYGLADGLTDNSVLRIVKDSKGVLWLLTFNGKLCQYKNGKIYNSTNDTFLAKIKLTSTPVYFLEDSKQNVWISMSDRTVQRISPSGETKTFDAKAGIIWENKNKEVQIAGVNSKYKYDGQKLVCDSTNVWIMGTTGIKLPGDTTLAVFIKDSLAILNFNVNVTKTYPFKKYFDASIQGICRDKENNIWVCSTIGAVRIEKAKLQDEYVKPYLTKYSVTTVFQDKENNLWFSTYGNGVIMIPSLSIKVLDDKAGLNENSIATVLPVDDDRLFIGNQNGSLQLASGGTVLDKEKTLIPPSGRMVSIQKDNFGKIWVLTNNSLFNYQDGNFKKMVSDISPWYKSLFISKKNEIWIGRGKGLSKLEGNKIVTKYYWDDIVNRVYTMAEIDNDGFLLGTDKGLYRFKKNGEMINESAKDSMLQHRINSMVVTNDSTLWMATANFGIMSLKNNVIRRYTTHDGLLSNDCNNLYLEGYKLYVCTNKGLNVIDLHNSNFNIKSYSTVNGLPSNHIYQVIRKNKNSLALATDRGVVIFNEGELPEPSASIPFINSIFINDVVTDSSAMGHLGYNENNMSVEFGTINFNSGANIKYRYKLNGIDSAWNYTSSASVKYSYLRPGRYNFLVSSQDAAGNWSTRNAGFNFYIETPWWQTWWFRIATIIVFLLIIIQTVRWRIVVNNRRLNQQRLVAESELKALRSQINPHFIYNSLNSIQDFIMQNQKEDANLYLAKFARLMRNILSYSRTPKITLAEEIESLSLYLELESLRFNNQFIFKFELNDNLDPEDIEIPSMILQPYVENAILHGLATKERGGKILIGFSKKENFLECVIEDNGIGRKKAFELKQQKVWKGSKSLGMKITKERIDLLSSYEKHKINLEIIDLVNVAGESHGTRVVIYFPLNLG